jgi:hypothetical protein
MGSLESINFIEEFNYWLTATIEELNCWLSATGLKFIESLNFDGKALFTRAARANGRRRFARTPRFG